MIERSESPWSSPLVPVRKKDGSWRFCIDYRVLNSNLEPFSFPAPNVEDILAGIGKKELFSQLDSSQAYLSVPLAAESRPLTAFSTPEGLFQFRSSPFGLINSGGGL